MPAHIMHARGYTTVVRVSRAHSSELSGNTLNQRSIISVPGCQRLWERATAHGSGNSQRLQQSP